MDAKDKAVLARISRGAPRHDVTKEIVDLSDENYARDQLQRKDIPPARRKKLQDLVDKGAFRRSETVENTAAIKELDEYHTREVAGAIARGELSDPANDPFIKERNQRMKTKRFAIVGEGIIKPGIGRALVRPLEMPGTKKSSIILVKEEKKKTLYGEVLALGPGKRNDDGFELPWEISVGDRILYGNYGYEPIVFHEQNVDIVESDSILGRFTS